MREVADGVLQLALIPRDGVNTYLVGETLIDAGIKQSSKKLINSVRGKATQLAITHAHPDHAGSAAALKRELGLKVLVGDLDVADAERGRTSTRWGGPTELLGAYPKVAVDRSLKEGDEVEGFVVLHTPGHSAGHVSYWRESDRVLICGDVYFNMNIITTRPGLHSPPWAFTPDPELNRASQQRLAELEPSIVLVGHGPPVTGAAAKLKAFLAK